MYSYRWKRTGLCAKGYIRSSTALPPSHTYRVRTTTIDQARSRVPGLVLVSREPRRGRLWPGVWACCNSSCGSARPRPPRVWGCDCERFKRQPRFLVTQLPVSSLSPNPRMQLKWVQIQRTFSAPASCSSTFARVQRGVRETGINAGHERSTWPPSFCSWTKKNETTPVKVSSHRIRDVTVSTDYFVQFLKGRTCYSVAYCNRNVAAVQGLAGVTIDRCLMIFYGGLLRTLISINDFQRKAFFLPINYII
jgi:hypothetical protein